MWISSDPRGHLQATGRDARRRKQYRYHTTWTRLRGAAKFKNLIAFARVLPTIRRQVARDLRQPEASRARVLGTVIALLEHTHIRVGNEEYARANDSYGLTTLQDRHVTVRGRRVDFQFRGKSGVRHTISLQDPRLARSVRSCQELPGQLLFAYRDGDGRVRKVTSSDVNRYLAEIAQSPFTAKDFRTWWGTVSAAVLLREAGPAPGPGLSRRAVVEMLDRVALELGNTRAVCRQGYVHPRVLDAYAQGVVLAPARSARKRGRATLTADERAVVRLLTSRPARGTSPP